MIDELEIQVIKTDVQYRAYLAEVGRLVALDPDPTSLEGKRLELLGLLVESYEKERFPIAAPTPVEAILFRLEQKGLQQKDLEPIIGSKGRVSEILNGKRRLTVPMIRKLSTNLDIPVSVLIAEPAQESRHSDKNARVPLVREIMKRGWVESTKVTPKNATEIVSELFAKLGAPSLGSVYPKTGMHTALVGPIDLSAVRLWMTHVVLKSREKREGQAKYQKEALKIESLADLARLSWFERGPALAVEYLKKLGIPVVFEKHLPGTRLDGAATLDLDGTPVIGLTLRHDRLDNFWFTLLHECAHVALHLRTPGEAFLDDTESDVDHDTREVEANRLARDTLIPQDLWRRSDANRLKTPHAIRALAGQLRIHPAIVAGRIRRESGNYKLFSSMVGYKMVTRGLKS